MKKFIKPLIILFILVGIAFLLAYQYIIIYAHNAEPEKSDVMIVLGCQVKGRTPSWSLDYRLKKALDLYNEGFAEYIIVSGGQGGGEDAPESTIMKEWLIKNGVNESKIMEESESTSTFENIKFSKEIMDSKSFKTAVIVTNDFHIFRSVKVAQKLGIQATGAPAPSVRYLKAYSTCREVLSLMKTFLLDF